MVLPYYGVAAAHRSAGDRPRRRDLPVPSPTGRRHGCHRAVAAHGPAIVIMDEAAAHLGSSPRRHCSGP